MLPYPVMPLVRPACRSTGQLIQFHRNKCKAANSYKAFDSAQSSVLYAGPAGLILNTALEYSHHQPHGIKRPGQIRKKEDDGLYPAHFKQFNAHIAHLGEKIPKEAYKLGIDPVDELIHNVAQHKIPYKHLVFSPLSVEGKLHFYQWPKEKQGHVSSSAL